MASSPLIDVVGAFDHAAALSWSDEWADVDIVIVDAAAEDSDGDQFPGVAVVRQIRAHSSDHRPVIVVVTAHTLHDGLRHRMARADADFFFFRGDLRAVEHLVDLVTHPESYRRLEVDGSQSGGSSLGIGPGSDIEGFVAYVEEHGLQQSLSPTNGDRAAPRSRRWIHHRRALAEVSRIVPVNVTTGDRPRGQDVPSIRQLARVWAWAARIGRPSN